MSKKHAIIPYIIQTGIWVMGENTKNNSFGGQIIYKAAVSARNALPQMQYALVEGRMPFP